MSLLLSSAPGPGGSAGIILPHHFLQDTFEEAAMVCNEVEKLFVSIFGAKFSLIGLGLGPLLQNPIPISRSGVCLISFSTCRAASPGE